MQLFTRRVQLAGPPARLMEYVTDMQSYVSGLTGRDIALWSGMFGGPVGTFVYATRVAGVGEVQAMMAEVMGDATYLEKVTGGADLVAAPSEDSLGVPIHGELGEESPPVGSVAQITSATIANGKYAEAFGWGVEMAQYGESLTGVPTMFMANRFGPFGSVSWIGVQADGAAADAANDALWADAEWMKRLGAAGDLFVEGSGHQALVTRIA